MYYSVLQSTTPVLLRITKSTPVLVCSTKYCSNTIPVLLQYYSVLQSTSHSLYYKVLLQYYFVLQSTSPYYKVLLQSPTPVLQRMTKYHKVLLQFYSAL